MPEDADAPAPPPPPTPSATRKADLIITVLLGLVVFVVVIGTLGNILSQSIRVDVALVAALLSALATYAIVGHVAGSK